MSYKSGIEWTESSWNPVSGCTHRSPGCDHCYAVAMTRRLEAAGNRRYAGLTVLNRKGDWHFNGSVRCHEDLLGLPLRWKKPRRIFANSMSDLFHERVPDEFILRVYRTMKRANWHVYQVLTKRPERMAEFVGRLGQEDGQLFLDHLMGGMRPHLDHVWHGASAENQETLDERLPHVLRCPSAVRILSLEPLLESVQFPLPCRGSHFWTGIHQIIVGGESGPGARPMHPKWVRAIRDQCQGAGVAFFFKQWGEWCPPSQLSEHEFTRWDASENAAGNPLLDKVLRFGRRRAGRLLDGREWNELPEAGQ